MSNFAERIWCLLTVGLLEGDGDREMKGMDVTGTEENHQE